MASATKTVTPVAKTVERLEDRFVLELTPEEAAFLWDLMYSCVYGTVGRPIARNIAEALEAAGAPNKFYKLKPVKTGDTALVFDKAGC